MVLGAQQAARRQRARLERAQRRPAPAPRTRAAAPASTAGPSAGGAVARRRARARSPRPGPVRVGQAAGSRSRRATVASASAGSRRASAGEVGLGAGERGEPCAAASSPPRARRPRRSAAVGGGSRTSSAASSRRRRRRTVLDLGLRLRVALDRVGGELVDVGEDRLGEQAERLGVEVGRAGRPARDPPPGDPGADPVGGLQRVERPALAQLAAAEGDVDLAADPAAGLGIADQGDELPQRLADAGADAAAEAALERARVLGHLAGDRREDLLGDRVELGLDQRRRPARRGRPRQGSDSTVFIIYLTRN